MEISAGFNFNTSADHLQQYWAVDEVMSCVFNEEILILDDDDDHERRPLKQLRRAEINSSTNRNLAERNRREKMSQKFAALSSLLPPSKKRDKACILEEAIKNITQLQKRVDSLEKKPAIKGAGGLKNASNHGLLSSSSSSPLIEAKAYDLEVLITIHYEKIMYKGVFESIVGVIEKLHLSVVSCSVVNFGDSDLNITIIAQMEEEYGMSIEEVVKILHMLLLNYNSRSRN